MIDADGQLTLFRDRPEDVWHILELRDGTHLVAPCGAMAPDGRAEVRIIAIDRLLEVGPICLVCAQALLSLS